MQVYEWIDSVAVIKTLVDGLLHNITGSNISEVTYRFMCSRQFHVKCVQISQWENELYISMVR